MKRLLFQPIMVMIFLVIMGCNTCAKDKESSINKAKNDAIPKIEFEGTVVPGGFDAIVEEVLNASADVVALSEVRNYDSKSLAGRLVKALSEKGHIYYSQESEGSGILSKFPILSQKPVFGRPIIKEFWLPLI